MWSDSDGERELKPNEVVPSKSNSGSDIAVFDNRVLQAAAESQPNIAQLNVSQNSKVHVGPKFTSVTQNVHNAEMVKTRFLGLELIFAKNTVRCSIAVFVCWALVVAVGLAFYLFKYTLPKTQTRLDIGLTEAWFLRRGDWQAMPPYAVNFRALPVSYVLVGHSATPYCDERYSCIQAVLDIQSDHLRRGFNDIGPNYLVSGDGLVFEGRGANVLGAMVRMWNTKSITIMFLGNYAHNVTRPEQFEHVTILLDELVTKRVLTNNYVLMGHCQVSPYIISPGKNLLAELHNFKHWDPVNKTYYLPLPRYLWKVIRSTSTAERLWCLAGITTIGVCLGLIVFYTKGSEPVEDVAPHEWNITRAMWLAQKYDTAETTSAYEPLRLVVIQHTVSQECRLFVNCAAEMRNLQAWNIRDCPCDIAYNFLIGNDGRVYEGRGWGKIGAHTSSYNRCALGIGFVGDYREEMASHASVTALQINRTMILLQFGVESGHLHPDYRVVGAKDIKRTASPGSNLYNAIRKWDHYNVTATYRNKSCDQIYHELASLKQMNGTKGSSS